MKLQEYLKLERGATRKLALTINAHAPDVSRWAAGLRPIPHKYGAAIEIATNNLVKRQEMFPNEWKTVWPELLPNKKGS